MKIYLAVHSYHYDGDEILGAFCDLDKAEKRILDEIETYDHKVILSNNHGLPFWDVVGRSESYVINVEEDPEVYMHVVTHTYYPGFSSDPYEDLIGVFSSKELAIDTIKSIIKNDPYGFDGDSTFYHPMNEDHYFINSVLVDSINKQ